MQLRIEKETNKFHAARFLFRLLADIERLVCIARDAIQWIDAFLGFGHVAMATSREREITVCLRGVVNNTEKRTAGDKQRQNQREVQEEEVQRRKREREKNLSTARKTRVSSTMMMMMLLLLVAKIQAE